MLGCVANGVALEVSEADGSRCEFVVSIGFWFGRTENSKRIEVTLRAKNLPSCLDRGAFDVNLFSTLLLPLYRRRVRALRAPAMHSAGILLADANTEVPHHRLVGDYQPE